MVNSFPSIQIRNSQNKKPIKKIILKKIIKEILSFLDLSDYKVSFVFVDNASITKLNRKYFKRNTDTDVIAFSLYDENDPYNFLGEVVISIEKAMENKKVFDVSCNEEIVLYIIHGLLHLVGYKDTNAIDKKNMKEKEKEVMFFLKKRYNTMVKNF